MSGSRPGAETEPSPGLGLTALAHSTTGIGSCASGVVGICMDVVGVTPLCGRRASRRPVARWQLTRALSVGRLYKWLERVKWMTWVSRGSRATWILLCERSRPSSRRAWQLHFSISPAFREAIFIRRGDSIPPPVLHFVY